MGILWIILIGLGYVVLAKDYREVERQAMELLVRCRRIVGKRLVVASGQVITAYHLSKNSHRRLLRNAQESYLCD
jgi:hypothetical protein